MEHAALTDANDLTLLQAAALLSGSSAWDSRAIRVAGVPSFVMSDGPHGVRRQLGDADHLGIAQAEKATCFPTASALAATWNPDLAREMGEALGHEARSLVVDVLLTMIPMTAGILPPLPQPVRLALVLIGLATLILVVTSHALRGRSLGGALLGLRAVDVDAGLPPASLHSILAALRLGSTEDVVIVSTRRGPDPTQGTLADLERTPALASSSAPTGPAPAGGPETVYSPPPSRPNGQYSASPTHRPAAAPVPAAERPVIIPISPVVPTPTPNRPPSLPPSIPVQRPHPPASGPGPGLPQAQEHTYPQQGSDTVEIQPIRTASPRPTKLGDFPPSPPPPPAPPSQRAH